MVNLVTGASGFIGSAIVRALLRRGETVHALVRPGRQTHALRDLPVTILRADITLPDTLAPVLEGVDRIYHTAAIHRVNAKESEFQAVNVLGTRNVLRAARTAGAGRVVLVSSEMAVGAAPPDALADEDTVWNLAPANLPYLTSLHLGEIEAFHAAATGSDVVVVNPGGMLGEWDLPLGLTGRWIVEFLNGRLPAVPRFALNVIDVDDAAEGAVLAGEQGTRGERYLITNWNTHLNELLTQCAQMAGREAPLSVPTNLALGPGAMGGRVLEMFGLAPPLSAALSKLSGFRWHFSNAKATRELGLSTRPVEETLDKAIRWYNGAGLVKRR